MFWPVIVEHSQNRRRELYALPLEFIPACDSRSNACANVHHGCLQSICALVNTYIYLCGCVDNVDRYVILFLHEAMLASMHVLHGKMPAECMFTCAYIYIYIIHTCIHALTYTPTYTYAYIHMHVHAHTYMHTSGPEARQPVDPSTAPAILTSIVRIPNRRRIHTPFKYPLISPTCA
jgi:hypothetical protein